MTDHSYYEELAALAAGGHLSAEEHEDLRAHMDTCARCREDVRAYDDLVCSMLPLTRDAASDAERVTAVPDAGARDRFLARARREGVAFSPEVDARTASGRFSRASAVSLLALAAAVVIAAIYVPQFLVGRGFSPADSVASDSDARLELERLRQENAQLGERVTTRERELQAQLDQIRKLRAELDTVAKTGGDRRADGQPGGQSSQQTASLLDELQNRDSRIAAATDEINRINQLRAADRATLDSQTARLKALRDQLRLASATLDMERQLTDAGRDLLQLLATKQLRVIDVRDTDVNGRPSAAFARVFVAEGRSVRIFAFDLDASEGGGARRFQVWGERLGSTVSVRSLGTLDLEDRTQNRWSVSIQNEALVKDIDSVFVTASTGATAPPGPRLLYTSLGNVSPP